MTQEVHYTDYLRSLNVSVLSSFMWTAGKKKKKSLVQASGNKPKPTASSNTMSKIKYRATAT